MKRVRRGGPTSSAGAWIRGYYSLATRALEIVLSRYPCGLVHSKKLVLEIERVWWGNTSSRSRMITTPKSPWISLLKVWAVARFGDFATLFRGFMVNLFTGMKLCTTLRSSDPFFFGGNCDIAPQSLAARRIIPAISISGKILAANSLFCLVGWKFNEDLVAIDSPRRSRSLDHQFIQE